MRYTNAMTYQRHSTLININNTWLSASEWLNLFLLIIPERQGDSTIDCRTGREKHYSVEETRSARVAISCCFAYYELFVNKKEHTKSKLAKYKREYREYCTWILIVERLHEFQMHISRKVNAYKVLQVLYMLGLVYTKYLPLMLCCSN